VGVSWEDLLESPDRVLPWYGSRTVHTAVRTWRLSGPNPPEHGWYLFSAPGGRHAELKSNEQQPADPAWREGHLVLKGYLVGDRFISDGDARVDPNPVLLVEQTRRVYCTELGIERFSRVSVAQDRTGQLVFLNQEFPEAPDPYVVEAYQDRKESVADIPGVTPALDLAFRWMSYQRRQHEEHLAELRRIREEEERRRAEEERVRELMKTAGSAAGRRELAKHDFETAAREALRVSGAELLDCRQSRKKGEMVVQYRFRRQRLECVVERDTLRIVDAGVCLTDHHTGEKYDTYFTLESLPGVIGEALDKDKLVVWRHA
jgi:hypothetical protein